MTIEEVISLICAAKHQHLTPVQELVLRQAWEGITYTNMARVSYYEADYLRNVASQLWQSLSGILGIPITKTNFRSMLRTRTLAPEQKKSIEAFSRDLLPVMPLEFPSSPVPLDSPFYIEHPPLEEYCYQELERPGSLIRIKGARKTGKSSLLARILACAKRRNYTTACIDFQQIDNRSLANLDKLLRSFCANISRQLNLQPKLDDYWDEELGSKISCTLYFQDYLFAQLNRPFVLALKEVNRIFEYPEIAREFLPLLRFWHEGANNPEAWQQLRLVVVHCTEVYVPLQLNQSPFNVGLPIQLSEFSLQQVQDLAERHRLDWANVREAQRLMAMVGGHPYLIRLALYRLGSQEVTLEQLLQEAPTLAGIYSDHLQSYLEILRKHPELAAALHKVVMASKGVKLEAIAACKLESLGLVKFNGDEVVPSCELYRLYFGTQLSPEKVFRASESFLRDRIKQLERENRELQRLCSLDDLTQLANRRYFSKQIELEWRRLARETAPLSLILCDIDFFKNYNDTYGHQAGDTCLQRVASAIHEVTRRPSDIVARYGGEEFAVILPRTEANGAVHVAERIREKVEALMIPHASSQVHLGFVTVSLGIASTIPESQHNSAILLRAADEALYLSKAQGRNRITLSPILNFGL